ncbi:MAG: FeoB-associated Cys-rich membrane protein [Lachnospiraceae bacterium]|nr:FeoB-associated Cys-rich membrane protein [Lachnospiraceae bacterium]
MGTWIAGIIVLAVVVLIVYSMVRNKKKGKSIHCGDCKNCGGGCH